MNERYRYAVRIEAQGKNCGAEYYNRFKDAQKAYTRYLKGLRTDKTKETAGVAYNAVRMDLEDSEGLWEYYKGARTRIGERNA